MRNLRQAIIICVVVLMSGIVVSGVGATVPPPTYNSGSFGCSSVSFSYTGNGSIVSFRVVDAGNQVISNTVVGQANGIHTLTLALNLEQDEGTVLQIQHDYFGWTSFGPARACATSEDENNSAPPPPPWEHFGGENAYAAFRFIDDGPDNPVLVFLGVSNNGEGSILFYISSAMLERDYPCTGEVIDIFSSDDGMYHLYRLPSCEIQANVGPDVEGKTYVVGFSSIPPGDDVFSYSFFSGGPYMRWFGDAMLQL